MFTENFDYESIRPHFINGILTSDLLGKAISCSIIGETPSTNRIREWASFVQDTKSLVLTRYVYLFPLLSGVDDDSGYSQALIARKCYPIAPDEHIPGQAITKTRRHQLRSNKVYVGQNVDLARFVGSFIMLAMKLMDGRFEQNFDCIEIADRTPIYHRLR